MYLEGPEPPFVSDGGWGARKPREEGDMEEPPEEVVEESTRGKRGRGRGRGGKGGRGGGRTGKRVDMRKVISQVRYRNFSFKPLASKLLAHLLKNRENGITQSCTRALQG